MRQQVAQSPQCVLDSEEREDEPQEFRQESHVGFILSRFLALWSTEWIAGASDNRVVF